MQLRRPSPALVVACLALLLAAGGGAYAGVRTTGNPVNIVDPVNGSAARVSSNGLLKITGIVATNAGPSSFVNGYAPGFTFREGCVRLVTPPTGKALVLTQVTVNTYINPTPGVSNLVRLFRGADCSGAVLATVNPGTVGATVLPFGPGIGIPAGSAVGVQIFGNVQAEAYAYGYAVGTADVPAQAASAEPPSGAGQETR
jgi:hypothetical protein